MPIYHASARNVSKAKDQRPLDEMRYVKREGKYKNQEDRLIRKESGNLPSWANDNTNTYWQAADKHSRSNERTAKKLEIALPNELPKEKRTELTRSIAKEAAREGQAYTFGIHEGKLNLP